MPAIRATAPAKIILFGEHSVVYGRPAIAVPVHELSARAVVSAEPLRKAGEILIHAPDISVHANIDDLGDEHPLAKAIRLTGSSVGVPHLPACTIWITSTIPIASGLGSGAAVSVALIRAFSAFLGHPLPNSEISKLAFEIDKLHHGTPSGIDNTTITFEYPVFFEHDHGAVLIALPHPFTIIIADTGVPSPTAAAVGDLRRAWRSDPPAYERRFNSITDLVLRGRELLESGKIQALGPLMNQNHHCLVDLGVSSPELDRLVAVAVQHGALGAKLSGGGRGGNMIALVDEDSKADVSDALVRAGAVRIIATTVAEPDKK